MIYEIIIQSCIHFIKIKDMKGMHNLNHDNLKISNNFLIYLNRSVVQNIKFKSICPHVNILFLSIHI